MANIQMQQLKKNFGDIPVIKGIDLDIKDREFICFLGPSGCGKSTLLRLMAGLEEISSGEFLIDNKRMNDVPASQRGISMVFQSYALYPHLTVRQNLAFGLKIQKLPSDEINSRIREVAKTLQLSELLDRKPKILSGGQRQRVAIGRAIVRRPKVFLLDEPLSNLDATLRVSMRVELARLHEELQATIVYVTHDQVEAMTLATRVVVMKDGAIQQFASPLELLHRPANIFVAEFIGTPKINLFKVEVQECGPQSITVTHALFSNPITVSIAKEIKFAAGTKLTLGIRPHRLSTKQSLDCTISAKVTIVERLGTESLLYTDLGLETLVICSAAGTVPIIRGDQITLGFSSANCLLFDDHDQAIERCLPADVQLLIS